jgi:hypothetical protein
MHIAVWRPPAAKRWPIGGWVLICTHLHHLAVGASNPKAVPCFVQLGSERGCDNAIRPIRKCREAPGRRTFKNIMCTSTPIPPARLVRYHFMRLDTLRTLSRSRTGTIFQEPFGGEEGTGGYDLVANVEFEAGNREAVPRHSLAADQPCGTRFSIGGEARSYTCRRRVVAGGATRHGGGGPMDRPPPVKLVTGGFG